MAAWEAAPRGRERNDGFWRRISCGGFSVRIYSAEALRHMGSRNPDATIIMRKIDHLKVFLSVTVAVGAAWAQAPAKEKQVKDQVEWNLFNDSTKTPDA